MTDAGHDKYSEALRRFSSDLRMVGQVWQSMQDREYPIERHHYDLLLDAFLSGRDLDGARRVIDAMAAAGLPPDPVVAWQLAIAQGRAGRTTEATAEFDRLRESGERVPDTLVADVFSIEIAAGRLPVARTHLRRMAALGTAVRPVEYRVLMDDVLRRRAIKDTRALLEAMVGAGVVPAPEDLVRLLGMMAQSGHADRAEQVIEFLGSHGVTAPGGAWVEIALAWARAGDVDRARTALAAAAAAGTEATSHHRNALLAAVIAGGDLRAAWDAAEELSATAIPSGANLDALCALSLSKGNLPLALSALDWMFMLGVPASPARVAEVTGGLLRARKLGTATRLFLDAAARGITPDRRRASDLLHAMVDAGAFQRATALLGKFRKDKVLTDSRHYGSLLAGLVRARRLPDAVALLRSMLEDGVTPTVADASRIVGELVRTKRYDDARELIDTLAGAGITVDEPTYRELMWKYAERGNLEHTEAVYQRLVAAGITPDDRHTKALQWASGQTQRRLEDADHDSPAEPSLDSPAEPSLDSPAEPSLDSPAEPSLEEPAQQSLEEPAQQSLEPPAEGA